jgi:hypothetical protein
VFSISLDTTQQEETFATMIEQCDGFPQQMATELTVWQADDLNRRYPNTDLKDDTVETDIWPRSRQPQTDKRKIREAMRRSRSIRMMHLPSVKDVSERPILRPSLYDRLVARMTALMEKCLSWQS